MAFVLYMYNKNMRLPKKNKVVLAVVDVPYVYTLLFK